jgi:hypothetical protein
MVGRGPRMVGRGQRMVGRGQRRGLRPNVSLPWVAEHAGPLELRSRATLTRHTYIRSPVATRQAASRRPHVMQGGSISCAIIGCNPVDRLSITPEPRAPSACGPYRRSYSSTKLFMSFDWVVGIHSVVGIYCLEGVVWTDMRVWCGLKLGNQ